MSTERTTNEVELLEFAQYTITFGNKFGMNGVSPDVLLNYYYKDKRI